MDSIQTNSPVIARALDFKQEAKRRADEDLAAAAKTENKTRENHPNRVFFSQEAQIRLNEEKSQDTNRVEEVRVTSRTQASEKQSQAITQEIQKAVVVKAESRDLRQSRDHTAREKAALSRRAAAQDLKESEAAADAVKKNTASAITKALEVQARSAKEFSDKAIAAVVTRSLNDHTQQGNAAVEKNTRTAVKNTEDNSRIDKAVNERVKTSRIKTEKTNTDTTKALNMYAHVSKMK
ncbi:MAG: hypothetical protein NTX56_01035 [Proteobacteria bacterium]|nr:hypothetical protein [Pseudomonadota bacterium]